MPEYHLTPFFPLLSQKLQNYNIFSLSSAPLHSIGYISFPLPYLDPILLHITFFNTLFFLILKPSLHCAHSYTPLSPLMLLYLPSSWNTNIHMSILIFLPTQCTQPTQKSNGPSFCRNTPPSSLLVLASLWWYWFRMSFRLLYKFWNWRWSFVQGNLTVYI